MGKRVSTRDRLHQLLRWGVNEWGYEARLRVEKRLPRGYARCLGCVEFDNDWPKGLPPLIRVKKTNRSEGITTLLHEYSHVIDVHENGFSEGRRNEGHDAKFRNILHSVESRFLYEGGEAESMDY